MNDKLTNFQKILEQNKLDGFIVTNPINIFYLTGFRGLSPTERESILIFNPKATLITARLYQQEALKLKSNDLNIKIAAERNEIFKFFEDLLKNSNSASRRIGFEESNLTFLEHKNIRKLTRAKLVPFRDLAEKQRMIKTDDEIKKIEKAQVISQKAFEAVLPTLKIGQIEEEIAEKLEAVMKSLGGQGLAFESIIASGPNSGLPHYFTGDRRLSINDILLFDFGTKYQDYCADLSRTVFIGRAKDTHKNIFQHVLTAQKTAIDKINHGISAHTAHELASEVFRQNTLHDYFLHGLGHGIGLEVHEKPSLRPSPNLPSKIKPPEAEYLLENMVFSVEPGLYFPWGGVRIEDLVTIKNGKAKVLGKPMTELVEISI
ncbi:MAG: Xaa-Pro peptidase family protein [Candidatus Curtissbacteria bacterium]